MLVSLVMFAVGQPNADWQDLFDGKTLDGWTRRGGEANYRVENGVLVGSTVPNTSNTFLCTEKIYGDFELEFEVKVHTELNSGVQIRSNSVLGYQNGRVHGYQVEIDPSERAYSGGVYDESRRGWLQDLSDNEAGRNAFRNGEWNQFRVVAVGDHIQVWVNGVSTADLHDDMTRHGFIGLQVHGVGSREDALEVRWRNIRIKDMGVPGVVPPEGATVLLASPADMAKWEVSGKPGEDIGWEWKDGYLEVVPGTGSIVTRKTYTSCILHVEFAVDENNRSGQANGNSGVYLQGRYEVQILNSAGQEPADNIAGGIYGVRAVDFNMAYPAYEWQSFDIYFTAPKWDGNTKLSNAMMTVFHNGTLIHRDVSISKGTTAGYAEDTAPAPIYLQNHGNRIRFRNIWILPQ
ncbi:MAG: DUF1080 domain-containing protein [Armatimonadetes bacterium]|nr:DUF1080 domain-containing protein [Armatimonadota bacterium]